MDWIFSDQRKQIHCFNSPTSKSQTKLVSKCLETLLQCMCSEKLSSWSQWLALSKWWYNTNFHSSIQTTPYEVVYGQTPPTHLPGEAPNNAMVDKTLTSKKVVIRLLQFHLLRAHNCMTQQAINAKVIGFLPLGILSTLSSKHTGNSQLANKLSTGNFQIIMALLRFLTRLATLLNSYTFGPPSLYWYPQCVPCLPAETLQGSNSHCYPIASIYSWS